MDVSLLAVVIQHTTFTFFFFFFCACRCHKCARQLVFDNSRDMFTIIITHERPRLQECSFEQHHWNSCLFLWWIAVPVIRWPLPQLFQMTPAPNWENTVPCNARWDTRGTILAVRCASAASPRRGADLWPAVKPALMDMRKCYPWSWGFLLLIMELNTFVTDVFRPL